MRRGPVLVLSERPRVRRSGFHIQISDTVDRRHSKTVWLEGSTQACSVVRCDPHAAFMVHSTILAL